jgi:Zn-dependent alcohol dehydrogenase
MWRPRCGQCAYCTTGRPTLCVTAKVQAATGGLLDGTSRLRLDGTAVKHCLGVSCFAEQCVVAEQSVIKIPAGTPPRIASLLGCAVITEVGAVLNVVREPAGRSMLVAGAGGVGLSAVIGAHLAGAYPIVVADVAADKLELARRFGATHTVDVSGQDLVEAVTEICDGGVDVAIEAVGRPQSMQQALACLRPERVNEAYDALASGAVGRAVILPGTNAIFDESIGGDSV